MTPVPFPRAEDDIAKLWQTDVNTITAFFATQESLAEVFHVSAQESVKLFQVRSARDVDMARLAQANWLALITGRLGRLYEVGTADKWLNGTNAFLENRSPMTCLKEGKYAEVVSALDQEAAHSYA